MKPTILFFIFIASFMYNVSVAQTLVTTNFQQGNSYCPLMEVNITATNSNGLYSISYCNHGNAIANGAYVEIEIANGLNLLKSTIPVTFQLGNKYTFDLGDVMNSDCSEFFVEIPNSADQIHCTKVHIYPDDPCQAMIDHYISHNNGNNNGNTTITVAAIQAQRHMSANDLLGQTTSNSIFEDHVFLDNRPSWDSLLHIVGHGPGSGTSATVNTSSNNNTNSTNSDKGSTSHTSGNDNNTAGITIQSLSSSEFCNDITQSNGGANNNNNSASVNTINISSKDVMTALKYKTFYYTSDNNKNTGVNSAELSHTDKKNTAIVSVNISPNPFDRTTTINITGAVHQITQVQIINVAGQVIKVLQVQEQQQITVDKERDNLSQGVYFYQITGDGAPIHTGKLVVR
ncbi:T9SS type A sorting domain-containing protein [Aureispira anguillae]|uniref:T9SS type A sorting domain-containing protein n=1 Tax=Aureispira anguillae TaxID=2864201 RepID=A0A915YKC3_9BACT|nr:T9SS type A sorting domain-containing protein [Aureispira anguillae]BDS14536.1 T9SS type A sorting domain-containing protein [Aureispira anguillae]